MPTVLEAILSATSDAHVRAAMALGALLEGGSLGAGPFPTGDNGTSPGPFQIHLPAHPGVTVAQAQSPQSAVAFMLPEYTGAAARVPASLWTSNPERAAEQTAMLAERPAKDYYTSRPGAVQSAWAKVTSALGGSTNAPNSTTSTAGSVGLLSNPADLGKTIVRVVIIGTGVAAGAGLVLLGVNKATGNPGAKAVRVAAGAAL